MTTRIEAVAFRDFPPFGETVLEFPAPKTRKGATGDVHLFTGENGTGKTRLLSLLAAACGNSKELDARFAKAGSCFQFVETLVGPEQCFWSAGHRQAVASAEGRELRRLLESPKLSGRNFHSFVHAWQSVTPAAALAFRGTASIADATVSAMAKLNPGKPEDHLTFERSKDEDTLLCQSMANLKMSAAMDHMAGLPASESRAIQMVEKLEAAISEVTGRRFTFSVARHPEVRLRVNWGGVEMQLGQLPDGLRSIIGWLVSCVAKLDAQFPEEKRPLDVPLILLLDEPENHLHPAWQRQVLPAAQRMFPQAQIFVATHSPFVISSVNAGWVYIFKADAKGVVKVDPPRPCSRGDSFLDVVEDVLGVKGWYDPETESLLADFRSSREAVRQGSGDLEALRVKASDIAERSDSLREIMAREMHQLERQLGGGTGA